MYSKDFNFECEEAALELSMSGPMYSEAIRLDRGFRIMYQDEYREFGNKYKNSLTDESRKNWYGIKSKITGKTLWFDMSKFKV